MYFNIMRKTVEPLLTVVCPTVVCTLIGLAIFGTRVFYPKAAPFQFVVMGLTVGILVLAAQKLSLIQFFGVTILLIIAIIVATGSRSPRLIPRVVVLMLALAGAALLNVKILAKTPQANVIGRFVTWTIVFILAYLLAGVTLLVIFRPTKIAPYLFMYGLYAVLMSIGLGIGFKIKEWLIQKLQIDKSQHAAGGDGV